MDTLKASQNAAKFSLAGAREAQRQHRLARAIVAFGLVVVMVGAPMARADAPLPSLDEMVAGLERFGASGKVIDENGDSIKKAEVFCYYMKGRDGVRDRFVGKTKTNRKGEFKFKAELYWEPGIGDRDVETGKYAFIAKHADYGINFRMGEHQRT